MHAVKVVIIVICMALPFLCMGKEAVELKQTPKNYKIISLCLKDDIDLGGNVILGEVFWTVENKSDTVINIPADNLGNNLYRVNYPDFVISAIDSEGHEWGMMAGFFRRAYDVFKLKPHGKMTFVSEIFLICDFYSIKGNGLNEKDFYIKMSGNLILSKSEKIEIFRDIKAQPKRCPWLGSCIINNRRNYDPLAGRYIQSDPIGFMLHPGTASLGCITADPKIPGTMRRYN